MSPLPEETAGGGAAAEGADVAAAATEAEAGYSVQGDAASAASLSRYETKTLHRHKTLELPKK